MRDRQNGELHKNRLTQEITIKELTTIMKIFAVYDSKAETHLLPAFIKNSADALRGFADAANNPEHPFCKYPADYTLFELGTYDEDAATFVIHEAKLNLGLALEYVKKDST